MDAKVDEPFCAHTHAHTHRHTLYPLHTPTHGHLTHTDTAPPPVALSIAGYNVLIESVISCLRGMKLDMMSVAH